MIQRIRLRMTLRRMEVARGKEIDHPRPRQEKSPGRRPRGRWRRVRTTTTKPATTRARPRKMRMRPRSDMAED